MKKSLSWKILLPAGIIMIIFGNIFADSFIGMIFPIIGLITFILGIVDGIKHLVKNKKSN